MENTNKLCNVSSVNYQKIKLDEFKKLVEDHFESDKASRFGIPNAGYFADKLMIQTADLENLVKNETGLTVMEHIESRLINTAKSKIFDTSRSINYTASELGFKNIHHFTRLFKDKTGMTPFKYRERVIKHFKNK
ncbi:helix-turn-helix domain-containing protein [Flavobacterium hungaricum]|uniref:AraC family transcriptional regulator n=1 Tax=Flavobacterium hungaricum TaxID=2082725 RepID=A0ABR9TLV2_9FLAO|nr:helix-turn-helix domain-containing protein [Flavobacterium hungaricum]MBE8726341.1 AraC family transcriptional regulator [Flavobacterium hungaricum]